MNRSLLELLRCPECSSAFAFANGAAADAVTESGQLRCANGHRFPIERGIPRFVATPDDEGQAQTAKSFGFKWQQPWGHGGQTKDFYQDWFLRRFGFASMPELAAHLSRKECALDAGAGNGQSARWYAPLIGGRWVGVDISASVDYARKSLPPSDRLDLVQGDILHLPFADATFDFVLSDGVLHHTPSTRDALQQVARVLKPSGEIFFYVYRKKAPIREFTDDHVRDTVARLPPEEAWEMLKPITKFGESLAGLGMTVTVPEAIPVLGINAGQYDLQRFVYDHILKLFWNDAFTFDENHHINFDWFHPTYAHRQTEDDVGRWCAEFGLDIVHQAVEVSGISVRAVKR